MRLTILAGGRWLSRGEIQNHQPGKTFPSLEHTAGRLRGLWQHWFWLSRMVPWCCLLWVGAEDTNLQLLRRKETKTTNRVCKPATCFHVESVNSSYIIQGPGVPGNEIEEKQVAHWESCMGRICSQVEVQRNPRRDWAFLPVRPELFHKSSWQQLGYKELFTAAVLNMCWMINELYEGRKKRDWTLWNR